MFSTSTATASTHELDSSSVRQQPSGHLAATTRPPSTYLKRPKSQKSVSPMYTHCPKPQQNTRPTIAQSTQPRDTHSTASALSLTTKTRGGRTAHSRSILDADWCSPRIRSKPPQRVPNARQRVAERESTHNSLTAPALYSSSLSHQNAQMVGQIPSSPHTDAQRLRKPVER